MLAHLSQERSGHRATSSNQNKLRRTFFKPVSFETIFTQAFTLHCGMHRAFGSASGKTKCGTESRIRKSCHDLSAIETDDRGYGPQVRAGLFELRAFGGVTRQGIDPSWHQSRLS
jgi:hypothetical protein